MIKNIISRLENVSFSIGEGVALFLSVVVIRTFFENISYRTSESFLTTDTQTIIHYSLFYFVALLGLILIIHFYSKRNLLTITTIGLLCFSIILTPPLIDFLLFKGTAGNQIAYLFTDLNGLIKNFFSFYQFQTLPGMPPGVRLEFFIIFIAIFTYIQIHTHSYTRSVLGVLTAYIYLFILFSFPSIIAIGHPSASLYFLIEQDGSLLSQNFFHPEIRFANLERSYEMLFNGVMTLTLYVTSLPLLFLYAFRYNKKHLLAIFKNARPERILHYFSMIGIGLYLGFQTQQNLHLNWISLGTIMCLFLSFFFAWMYAVGFNDCIDIESDAISNPNRPLVTGVLSVSEMKKSNNIFLFLMFLSGYLAGNITLFMVIIFTALYYIYSSPPLKFKRFLGVNSFIIGLCALTTFIAGYLTLSADKTFDSLPHEWSLLIFISIALIANVKDIKDIEGDTQAKVFTIPVIFGDKIGKKIISFLIIIALLLPPLLLQISTLYYLAPIFGFLSFIYIHKKPFTERYIFYIYYAYILLAASFII